MVTSQLTFDTQIKMSKNKLKPVAFRDFIKTPQLSFRLLGINIYPKPNQFGVTFIWYSIIHQIVMTFTIGSFPIVVYLRGDDMMTGMASALLCITELSTAVKLLITYFKRDQLYRIFKKLENNFPSSLQMQQEYGLDQFRGDRKFIKYWMNQSYATLAMMLCVSVIGMLYLFLKTGTFIQIFLMKGYYPYSTDNWYAFIPTFLFQTIGGLQTTIGFIGFDMILASIIILTCVQFQILKSEIEKMDKQIGKIPDLVEMHQNTMDIVKDINDIFSGYILFSFTVDTAQICVNLFVVLVRRFENYF